ncbi:MAG: hydroxyacid dehydrogenase [Verrucomicrobia bacterium]|nr:hydroxyacid dehydrogenase [Verrucomicrobiota bacterium]
MIVKVLEPIGFEDSSWINDLQLKFSLKIEQLDTRSLSDEALTTFIKDANALILSNRPLRGKVLASCPNLSFISVAFTGIDHIDADEVLRKKIKVRNAAGYATHAVSELALGLSLELYRKIRKASESLSQKDSNCFPLGLELFDKKVGIIGGGAIGSESARLFTAFGCKVSSYRRNSSNLEEILKTSDILSLHLPLTSETRHFINKDKLLLMKPTAILINTARGPIIDQEALIFALKHKVIAGAALDVFDIEPPLPLTHPLLQIPNVLLTPHIGYRTQEAAFKKASIAIKNLEEWLDSLKLNKSHRLDK